MEYADEKDYPADFEIHYRFYTPSEGGRIAGPPHQHCQYDWSYEADDIEETGTYVILPEFVSGGGVVHPEGQPVPWTGLATMWIVSPESRVLFHRNRLRPGAKGYLMEGTRRVAEATVTRLLGLFTNPTRS